MCVAERVCAVQENKKYSFMKHAVAGMNLSCGRSKEANKVLQAGMQQEISPPKSPIKCTLCIFMRPFSSGLN